MAGCLRDVDALAEDDRTTRDALVQGVRPENPPRVRSPSG